MNACREKCRKDDDVPGLPLGLLYDMGSAAWINPSEPLVPAPSQPAPVADVRLREGASADEKSEESIAGRAVLRERR